MKKRLKILIVDDDKACREVLAGLLDGIGEKDFAVNGVDAVEKITAAVLANKHYDIILQDIMMPDMTGIQVVKLTRALEKIAKLKRQSKILIVTGLDDDKTIINSFSAGADGFLVKPFKYSCLMKKLSKLTEGEI